MTTNRAGAARRATYTPREVAALTGVGKAKVYGAIKAGDLPAVRWGSRYLAPADAVPAFLGSLPAAHPEGVSA